MKKNDATSVARQRRSKNEKDKTKNENNVVSNEMQRNTDEALKKAMLGLLHNKAQALALHSQWRSFLLCFSLLAFPGTIKQVYDSVSKCLVRRIESNPQDEELQIVDMLVLLARAASRDLAGAASSVCVVVYLLWEKTVFDRQDAPNNNTIPLHDRSYVPPFSHVSFPLAAVSAVVSLGLSLVRRFGLIEVVEVRANNAEDRSETATVSFGVVYFFVCAATCWFMSHGISRIDDNIDVVNEMKANIEAARKNLNAKRNIVRNIQKTN